METRVVFHIDFDYFYAQCEEMRSPELKSKPVCVCVFSDRGADSGAIATANYTARKYGVKSGIPISFAKKRLEERKDAVFLPVDFDFYSEISEKAMEIMKSKSDVFEYVGRDEAYLDVTERVGGDFEKASHLAQQIKNLIRDKIKLSCSIGISPNKLVSKIASDFRKPDGLTVVTPDKISEFLEPQKIRVIPGIGKKTDERFSEMDLETIRDLKKLDIFALNKEFGRKSGTYIYNAVRGIDNEPVKEKEASIQYSKITTLKKDSKEYQFLSENLVELCKEVHEVLIKNNRMFKSIGIHFVQSDLSNRSKSRMLRSHTTSLEELKKNAEQLLKEALENQTMTVRRLGVKVSELSEVQGQRDITSYF
ncbi:putative DNA polymerase IV [Candidatus Nitrosopumilus salaria BD31]|uniref:DNA polymerase IV n=1 Tax=Candidatus Nitrosopumilus salarius BD31 TaxID=859350 RepID=I3D341_9ARCH|nr:DNA polymerase IV [Candidatus Nitrosopumilus salaria]EIJ66134.1 putative DNA polymerase IV [Candidatus Nitrosopumilus salaria BD31]